MATGRSKLIFAGISLEACAAFPAMTAVARSLDAYVAVDASGSFSATKREAGPVYAALDMPWATLVGQIAASFGK